MNIIYLELPTRDLQAQKDYYANLLKLPVSESPMELKVQAGESQLIFTQADPRFDGAYHFAFNIPENQFHAAKEWISNRSPLLKDIEGNDEFHSDSWNSKSLYFKDAAGNVLEFIVRHSLPNAMDGDFGGDQILNISEIGLPSEDVIQLADELCVKMGVSVFKQKPSETFTPIGDDYGLLILPAKDRIWIPNSGVPAKLLPVKVKVEVIEKEWVINGYPYTIIG
jgi:catechol-2,3-dioxygenase